VARLEQQGRGASRTATVARELLHSMERVARISAIATSLKQNSAGRGIASAFVSQCFN
jgi:hypothetical protein